MDVLPTESNGDAIGDSPQDQPNRWALFIRAFSHRNYRLFFGGQLVSLIGTFLTQIAMPWLVYQVTGSVILLGVVAFSGQIPMFLLAPFAGVWVDRWNRQRLLVITQSLSMIQSFGLAAIAYEFGTGRASNHLEVGCIIGLALFQGLVNAFDIPGRQAFLVEMVDKREDLANAIALNSTMVHGARFIGPAIGGYLISKVGPTCCFALDGFSYLGVILAFIAMRIKPRPPRTKDTSVLHDLREGMRYIGMSMPISTMLILLSVLSLTGMPGLTTLMPVFAKGFGGDAGSARVLGMLMAASGLGAMIASVYLASRKSVIGLGRLIGIATIIFGLAIFFFAWSGKGSLPLALAIVPVAGVGMLISFASANTLIQTLTDDHMRGRVMSFFTMAFIGMSPWGNLIAGLGANALGGAVIGASRMLMISGVIVLLAGVGFVIRLPSLRHAVRPIYIRKGIIVAPVREGVETEATVVTGPQQ